MMPLTFCDSGVNSIIKKKTGGKEETKRFLESLGFVVGAEVEIPQQWQVTLLLILRSQELQ